MDILNDIKLKLSNLIKIGERNPSTIPLRIFEQDGIFYLVFKNKVDGEIHEIAAKTEDGFSFEKSSDKIDLPYFNSEFPNSNIVSRFKYRKQNVMYFGDRSVNLAYSQDGKAWRPSADNPILLSSRPIEVAGAFELKHGLLLLYHEKTIENEMICHSTFMALFDKKNPKKALWKTNRPVWQQKDLWPNQKIAPLGSLFIKKNLIAYWLVDEQNIFGVIIAGFKYDPRLIDAGQLKLKKHLNNPIITPRPKNSWEAFNTFNPAVLNSAGKIHILYRAQGFDYISTVGYASSADGFNIDERLDKPIFTPTMNFEKNMENAVKYDFVSGGGYGGCEDPRLTQIDNKVYMTYVAFDGWSSPRLALTSILLDEFLNKRWLWSKPILISPPGVVDKSGCLLSERINGKYVFFHRIFPNILIDFVDDLNFDGGTKLLKGQYRIKIRPDRWDSRKIGAGAPPIKTKYGWLLIYYGVDDRDASKYHIGAMLLDLKNPVKVLHRTDEPILQPTEEYENSGFKPGIAYPCGAVIMKDKLLVYYGAADSVVCVATAKLDDFLNELISKKPVHLYKIKIREVNY